MNLLMTAVGLVLTSILDVVVERKEHRITRAQLIAVDERRRATSHWSMT